MRGKKKRNVIARSRAHTCIHPLFTNFIRILIIIVNVHSSWFTKFECKDNYHEIIACLFKAFFDRDAHNTNSRVRIINFPADSLTKKVQ